MKKHKLLLKQLYKSSLYHLCKYGLGMKDVTVYTHGGMIRNLQAPTKRKLIVMPRGSLKCVDPDSLITLPNAEQKKASELVVGDSVLSWSTKGFSANRISAKQINVSQNMREILFRSGKKIRVSHNHPLLTIEGFKQPNEITIGTRIGSWAGNTIEGLNHYSHEEMFFLGVMIGDAGLSGGNVSVVLHHVNLRNEVLRCAQKLGFKWTKYPSSHTYGFSGGVREWLDKYNLKGTTSHTKSVPQELFHATLEAKRSFIAGYLSCDGCFSKKNGKMHFATVSDKLAKQMQQLLLSIGVYSKHSWKEYDYGNIKPAFFDCSIVDPISIRNLLLCPFVVKKNSGFVPPQDGYWRSVPKDWRKVAKPFRSRVQGYRIDNKYDTSYTKFKKFSDEINMSWACSDEITWDEIRSVSTYIGPSIDFEIENDHTFLVDGIITHNSSIGITAYSIWKLINNPNERILIDSEVYENSKNFLREIKAYLQSPHMTEVFGDFRGSVWGEGELTIAQRTHPYKEASVTAGGVNTVKVGQHYSVIISDDLNSGNNSGTPEMRAKVLNHYRLNDAILDPGGTYVVIGTRYADDDVIGNILKNEIGIK